MILSEKLETASRLIIYGAGPVVKQFLIGLHQTPWWQKIICITVSSMKGNPGTLLGLPVFPLRNLPLEAKDALFLVATIYPHYQEICRTLHRYGYKNILDCTFESAVAQRLRELLAKRHAETAGERYHTKDCLSSVTPNSDATRKSLAIYELRTHLSPPQLQTDRNSFLIPLQVGRSLTSKLLAPLADTHGINISSRFLRYRELTGTYWAYKHSLSKWIGICSQSRHFLLSEDDCRRLIASDYDVVLPTPIMNSPSVSAVYAHDHVFSDWMQMLDILDAMYPSYHETALRYFQGHWYHGFNMLIARADVFDAYCNWLFPLLFELDRQIPEREGLQQQVIAYLSDHLSSLYFEAHRHQLNILYVPVRFLPPLSDKQEQ